MAEPSTSQCVPDRISGCDLYQDATREQSREYSRVYSAGRGCGRPSGRFGTLGWGWQRELKFLAQRDHRFTKPRRERYFHGMYGWTEWIQGSGLGGFSSHPDPALHHPPNSQQFEVRYLE